MLCFRANERSVIGLCTSSYWGGEGVRESECVSACVSECMSE